MIPSRPEWKERFFLSLLQRGESGGQSGAFTLALKKKCVKSWETPVGLQLWRLFCRRLHLSRLIVSSACVWLSSGFPADCLLRGVLGALRVHKCSCGSWTKQKHGANGRREGKLDVCWFIFHIPAAAFVLFFLFIYINILLLIVFYWVIFPEEPSAPRSFSGSRLCLSCARYLRVTGWHFCNFPLRLEICGLQNTTEEGKRVGERQVATCCNFLALERDGDEGSDVCGSGAMVLHRALS